MTRTPPARLSSPAAPIAARRPAPTPRRLAEPVTGPGFPLETLRIAPEPQRTAVLEAEEPKTEVAPRLEVGPADDAYEREAEEIAGSLLRLPDEPAVPVGPRRRCAACDAEERDRLGPRRRCAACGSDADRRPRRRSVAEAERETGPPALAASASSLTAGGAPLAPEVREFFETRLGRDLSAVRIHEGPRAQALAESISARAFTYGAHVWLGAGERADAATRTLGHELVHVLQQTQPKPLASGDDAVRPAAVRRRIQRAEAFWWPTDPAFLTAGRPDQGAAHDRALDRLGRANRGIITEAPIPNGGRVPGGRTPGFADLFKASTTIGLKLANPPAIGGGAAPALANFDQDATWPRHRPPPRRGGRRFDHDREARPELRNGRIKGIGEAPKEIGLGDLKPGFQRWPRGAGVFQLDRYRERMRAVADATNAATGSSPPWPLAIRILNRDDVEVPPGWHADRQPSRDSLRRKLVLHRGSGRLLTPSRDVFGHLIVGHDPAHGGIWNYFWVPSDLPGATALAGSASAEWGRLASDYQALVRDLRASPLNVRRSPIRPGPSPAALRLAERRAARVSRAATAPRRRPRDYGRDPFDHARWQRQRRALGRAFAGFERRHAGPFRDLESAAAAAEAERLVARSVEGYRARSHDGLTARRLGEFTRIEFLTGPRGRALGVLRRVFGRAYVQIARAYQRLAERFRRRMRAPRGVGGTWVRAALLALVNVLRAAAGVVLVRAASVLAARIEGCVERQFASLFDLAREELELDRFDATVAEVEALIGEIGSLAAMSPTAIAERLLGPYAPMLEALEATLEGFGALSTVISIVQWGVRLAACAAPPAVGCLWNLAIGAIEFAIAQIVQSCWFLREVTPYAMRVGFIARLPGMLADGIMEAMRGILPEGLHRYLCLDGVEADLRTIRPPSESEVPCEDGPRARRPNAPAEAVERLGDLAELDPELLEGLRAWARRERVPNNTSFEWRELLDLLDHAAERGLSGAALAEALDRSVADPGADGAVARFAQGLRERGAATRAANRRAEAERRRRERAAAAAGGEGGSGIPVTWLEPIRTPRDRGTTPIPYLVGHVGAFPERPGERIRLVFITRAEAGLTATPPVAAVFLGLEGPEEERVLTYSIDTERWFGVPGGGGTIQVRRGRFRARYIGEVMP